MANQLQPQEATPGWLDPAFSMPGSPEAALLERERLEVRAEEAAAAALATLPNRAQVGSDARTVAVSAARMALGLEEIPVYGALPGDTNPEIAQLYRDNPGHIPYLDN